MRRMMIAPQQGGWPELMPIVGIDMHLMQFHMLKNDASIGDANW